MEILDRTEESGLDKLIKLLTEHCRKHYGFKDNDVIDIDHDSVQFYLYYDAKRYFSIGVEKVISKEFGFIKWLVDNDKIDRSKVLISFSMAEYDGLGNMYGHGVDDNQRLLMILAISDTPIEDLISYLKIS